MIDIFSSPLRSCQNVLSTLLSTHGNNTWLRDGMHLKSLRLGSGGLVQTPLNNTPYSHGTQLFPLYSCFKAAKKAVPT